MKRLFELYTLLKVLPCTVGWHSWAEVWFGGAVKFCRRCATARYV